MSRSRSPRRATTYLHPRSPADHASPLPLPSPHLKSPDQHASPPPLAQTRDGDEDVYLLDLRNADDELDLFDIADVENRRHNEPDLLDTGVDTDEIVGYDTDIGRNGDESPDYTLHDYHHRPACDHIRDAKRLMKHLRKTFSPSVILGFMSLYGKVRLTLEQYSFFACVMRETGSNARLPSHGKIRQHLLPHLMARKFVSSELRCFEVTKDGDEGHGSARSIPGILVSPLSWAVMDVACVHVADELFCKHHACSCHRTTDNFSTRTIEQSNIVQNPEDVFHRCRSFWVDLDGFPYQARVGDCISISTNSMPAALRTQLASPPSLKVHKATGRRYCIEMTLRAVLFVGSATSSRRSTIHGDTSDMSPYQLHVLDKIRSYATMATNSNDSDKYGFPVHLFPGDVCSVLGGDRGHSVQNSSVVTGHVSRFWRTRTAARANVILWFTANRSGTLTLLHVSNPDTIPVLVVPRPLADKNEMCLTRGRLPCGTTYYVYRILLYCDDFQSRSMMFPKGSVGGCYMLPIGASPESRRSNSSVRIISLTAHGVSTNLVIDAIIEDLRIGGTKGVPATDAKGNKCVVFVDVVGFVGDYSASSAVLDVMSHAAHTPCTHCTFRVLEGPQKHTLSQYAHSSEIHSANTSFSRGLAKTRDLRTGSIGKDDSNLLGMNVGTFMDVHTPGLWPLLRLSEVLSTTSVSEVTNGNPLRVELFDAYSRNVVAPDHLLTGLITNLVECCFDEVTSGSVRKRLEVTLLIGVRKVGVEGQRSLYNRKLKKLHSMSMSTKYSILLVLPYSLRVNGCKSVACLSLIDILHSLVRLMFWWPDRLTDGVTAVQYVHGGNQAGYHQEILHLSRKYLGEVKRICKEKPELKVHLDRPNVHRLLELAVHTIPLYSHASFVAEMVFESAHQPLKASLGRSTNPNAHIYATQVILARDWLCRLAHLLHIVADSDHREKESAMAGILYLCGGKLAHRIDWNLAQVSELKQEIHGFLMGVMNDCVQNRLCAWYGLAEDGYVPSGWQGVRLTKSSTCLDPTLLSSFLNELTQITGTPNAHAFSKAIFYREINGLRRRRYKQHILYVGDAIDVLVDIHASSDRLIEPSSDGLGQRYRLYIAALGGWERQSVWAAVSKFTQVGDASINLYDLEPLMHHRFVPCHVCSY